MWTHKTGGIIIAMMMWWYDMEWQKFSLSTTQFRLFRFRFWALVLVSFFFGKLLWIPVVGDDIEKDSVTKPPKTINRRTRWRLRAKRKRKSNDKKYMQGLPVAVRLNFTWATLSTKSLCRKTHFKGPKSLSVCSRRAFYKQSISVAFYSQRQRISKKWI